MEDGSSSWSRCWSWSYLLLNQRCQTRRGREVSQLPSTERFVLQLRRAASLGGRETRCERGHRKGLLLRGDLRCVVSCKRSFCVQTDLGLILVALGAHGPECMLQPVFAELIDWVPGPCLLERAPGSIGGTGPRGPTG